MNSTDPRRVKPGILHAFRSLLVCVVAFLAVRLPAAEVRPRPALGINLSGPADWNTELPFVDAFRLARAWISQQQGAGWGSPSPFLDL